MDEQFFNNPEFMNQLAQHVMTNTDFMNQLFASYASTSNSTSANVSQSNGVNFKPPKPDKFGGEMRLVESHLFELRAYLSFCREFSSDVAKITASATFLKDRAAIWYRNVLSRNEKLGTIPFDGNFETYCDTLKKDFSTVNSVKRARDKLAIWKQKESAASAISDFRSIILEIPNITDEELLDRFIRGLKPEIRQKVEEADPDNLEDAMRIADRTDNIQYAIQVRNNGNYTPRAGTARRPGNLNSGNTSNVCSTTSANINGPTPMDLSSINAHEQSANANENVSVDSENINVNAIQNRYGGRLTPELREILRREGRCFYCGELGHTLQECSKRPTTSLNARG